jgi:hypothetical protein
MITVQIQTNHINLIQAEWVITTLTQEEHIQHMLLIMIYHIFWIQQQRISIIIQAFLSL